MKVTRTVRTTQEVEACDREGCEGYKDAMHVVLRSFEPDAATASGNLPVDEWSEPNAATAPGNRSVDEWSGTLCGKCLDMIFGRIKAATKRGKKAT